MTHPNGWLAELAQRGALTATTVFVLSTFYLVVGMAAAGLTARWGPAVRSAIYRCTLILAICGPALGGVLPARPGVGIVMAYPPAGAPRAVPAAVVAPPATPRHTEPAPGAPEPPGPLQVTPSTPLVMLTAAPLTSGSGKPSATRPAQSTQDRTCPLYLLGVWAAGSLFLLGRIAAGQRQLALLRWETLPVQQDGLLGDLRRIATLTGCAPPEVRYGARVQAPFVTGFLRPTLYVPVGFDQSLDPEARAAVLTHELAHVARRDCMWNAIACLACALLWTHPLAWLLQRRLEQSAEEACDEEVVRSGYPRARYARLLVDLAERLLQPAAPRAGVAVINRRTSLAIRVEHLLNVRRRLAAPSSRVVRPMLGTGTVLAAMLSPTVLGLPQPGPVPPEAPHAVISITATTAPVTRTVAAELAGISSQRVQPLPPPAERGQEAPEKPPASATPRKAPAYPTWSARRQAGHEQQTTASGLAPPEIMPAAAPAPAPLARRPAGVLSGLLPSLFVPFVPSTVAPTAAVGKPAIVTKHAALAPPAPAVVSGAVTDEKTELALAGVEVVAMHLATGARKLAVTDAEGRYILHLQPGRKSVFVQGTPNYPRRPEQRFRTRYAIDLVLGPADVRDASFRIDPAELRWDVPGQFMQPPACVPSCFVDGRVINSVSGVPLAGVQIWATRRHPAGTALIKTDEEGRFRLTLLPGWNKISIRRETVWVRRPYGKIGFGSASPAGHDEVFTLRDGGRRELLFRIDPEDLKPTQKDLDQAARLQSSLEEAERKKAILEHRASPPQEPSDPN